MDFARKQLEKYGWTAGKGLGKYENGISEALKPKVKRSVTGVGHDSAADFTKHWWNDLYNKAAENLEVEEENGRVKKIKRKNSSDFEITNNIWQIKKKNKGVNVEKQYSDYFVKTAILSNDGIKVENSNEAESDNEELQKDVCKISDEELLAACEGRTAHKGARHGLKALGKLARIEQQEQMLLTQAKYVGYSHAKKGNKKDLQSKNDSQVIDNNYFDNDVDEAIIKKKKKKKKHCHIENSPTLSDTVVNTSEVEDCTNKNAECQLTKPDNINKVEPNMYNCDDNISVKILKKKKSKRKNNIEQSVPERYDDMECGTLKKMKKVSEDFVKTISDVDAKNMPLEQHELDRNFTKKPKKNKRKE